MGDRGPPLSYHAVPLKCGTVMSPIFTAICSWSQYVRRMQIVLGCTKYPTKISRPCSLSRASKFLAQADEDVMEDRLSHDNELLKQICLKGGNPVPLPARKP